MKAVPRDGNDKPAAIIALPYASPNVSPMPITSPVECISGPRTGSTSGNFPNGNTGDFTKNRDTVSSSGKLNFFRLQPALTSEAMRAIGTPVALETNGTVRDARGFTSST